jgi:hypothetical protein
VRRSLLCLALLAAFAAGCSKDNLRAGLNETEACKAVKEHLDANAIAGRFGKPDATQDFFGDSVVSYDRAGIRWEFQVSAKVGTIRALQVKGSSERPLTCPA